MSFADTLLQQTLTNKRQPTAPFEGPQEGIVVSADDTTGTVMFTIPAFNRQVAFGPAPYQPVTGAGVPPAGTRCLVVFAGPDPNGDYAPWVVSFGGWPT